MLIFSGVARLIANHPILSVFESAPKVGVLPSTGVTRLHQYYFPVRLPPAAAALSQRRGRYPRYDGSPPFHGSPSRRAVPTTPADRMGAHVDYFPIRAAFPDNLAGRHPRRHFRGLLGLHSCYGPPGCSTTQGGLCHEASIRPVTQPNRSSVPRPIDNYLGEFFLHGLSVPFRGTQAIGG